jgi:hypothetical protein
MRHELMNVYSGVCCKPPTSTSYTKVLTGCLGVFPASWSLTASGGRRGRFPVSSRFGAGRISGCAASIPGSCPSDKSRTLLAGQIQSFPA